MGYAIRKDGQGWRSVDSIAQIDAVTETFSATPPVVDPLVQARGIQMDAIYAAYVGAISADVIITTAGGVTKPFQADAASIVNVQAMLAAFPVALPAGFYWIASDNTQVPIVLADLKALAAAMGNQDWTAFQRLQARKASVRAAATVAAVQAVLW